MKGKIVFDPPNRTKKHTDQSEWKKVILVEFDDDYDAMWRWYMNKRYNLPLLKPLRGSHITIVNDKYANNEETNWLWNKAKEKYNGQDCTIINPTKLQSNGDHWWLKIEDVPMLFTMIRRDLNLGDPYFDFHYTIGLTNSRTLTHSKYILETIKRYGK